MGKDQSWYDSAVQLFSRTVFVYLRPPSPPLQCVPPPMKESMDMDMSSLKLQNNLVGYELKSDKNDHFEVGKDENEHQLSLRMVSLGVGAKDRLHIVEAEALNYEGSPIKVTLAILKMSVKPTVCFPLQALK